MRSRVRYIFLIVCAMLLTACGNARVHIGTEISNNASGQLIFVVDMDSEAQDAVDSSPCQTILSRIEDMNLEMEMSQRTRDEGWHNTPRSNTGVTRMSEESLLASEVSPDER